MAKNCRFFDCMRELLLMGRLLLGISDDKTREELLSTHDLMKSLQIYRTKEAASLYMKALRNEGWPRNLRDKRLVKTNISQKEILETLVILVLLNESAISVLNFTSVMCWLLTKIIKSTQRNLATKSTVKTCQFPSWLWL